MNENKHVEFFKKLKEESLNKPLSKEKSILTNPIFNLASLFFSLIIFPVGLIMSILYFKNNQKTLGLITGLITFFWIAMFFIFLFGYLFSEFYI